MDELKATKAKGEMTPPRRNAYRSDKAILDSVTIKKRYISSQELQYRVFKHPSPRILYGPQATSNFTHTHTLTHSHTHRHCPRPLLIRYTATPATCDILPALPPISLPLWLQLRHLRLPLGELWHLTLLRSGGFIGPAKSRLRNSRKHRRVAAFWTHGSTSATPRYRIRQWITPVVRLDLSEVTPLEPRMTSKGRPIDLKQRRYQLGFQFL